MNFLVNCLRKKIVETSKTLDLFEQVRAGINKGPQKVDVKKNERKKKKRRKLFLKQVVMVQVKFFSQLKIIIFWDCNFSKNN